MGRRKRVGVPSEAKAPLKTKGALGGVAYAKASLVVLIIAAATL